MSIAAREAVWEHSQAAGSAKLLLLAIAEHADNEGVCWPGIKRLSIMTNTTERHTKRLIQQLEALGELKAQRSIGRGNTNTYQILLPLEKVTSEAEKVTSMVEKVTHETPFSESEKVTSRAEKVTSRAEKVTSLHIKGDADVTQTNIRTERTDIEPKDIEDPFPFRPGVKSAVVSEAEQRLQAILDVCGLDGDIPAHLSKAEHAAAQLRRYDAQEIYHRYAHTPNPNGSWYWYRDDWRGAKGQQPQPAQIVETISKQRLQPAAPVAVSRDEIIDQALSELEW